jgi:hypothetical protein
MYDHGDEQARKNLIYFAIQKLRGDPGASLIDKRYAVLSQRLALDIHSTAYVSNPISAYNATLNQIANHMRVCVEIGEGNESLRGIAASEPILSEAASFMMRREPLEFDLPTALSEVLSGFAINVGDLGELLAAAFFTSARDTAIEKRLRRQHPFCTHLSVKDLFSSLFSEETVKEMFLNTPSICPSKTKQQTLGEVAGTANMHFNHFIQAQEQEVIAHQYLIAFIARGAAVLGANCQPGFDAVFPYLFGSTVLEEKNIGFIMVQVKNDQKFNQPDARLFRKMDPFDCGLLDADVVGCFPIPIIRIVFALRGTQRKVTHMTSSPEGGSSSSEHKARCFISYDYWCSGIDPKVLQPV